MSTLQRQLLLRAYLLAVAEPPAAIDFEKRSIRLSRFYLCHLAMGGRTIDREDLAVVDLLLDGWEHNTRKGAA